MSRVALLVIYGTAEAGRKYVWYCDRAAHGTTKLEYCIGEEHWGDKEVCRRIRSGPDDLFALRTCLAVKSESRNHYGTLKVLVSASGAVYGHGCRDYMKSVN